MTRPSSEEGYVTLAVLVVTGLLAVIVSSLLMITRPALGLARVGSDEAIAEALVEGGLQAAGYLLFPAQADFTSVNGLNIRLQSGTVRLAVMDEGGRIDLNGADQELLAGLYRAEGNGRLSPEFFAARVIDWRDEDNNSGVGGAEAVEYEDAGIGNLPPNAPFRSVEELRLVLGVSSQDFASLAPHLTVFNPDGGVDPLSAPRAVLEAVPGLSPADVDRLLNVRRQIRDRVELIAVLSTPNPFLATEPSGAFRVAIEASLPNGFSDAAEAVLVESTERGRPFGVAAWRRLAP